MTFLLNLFFVMKLLKMDLLRHGALGNAPLSMQGEAVRSISGRGQNQNLNTGQ